MAHVLKEGTLAQVLLDLDLGLALDRVVRLALVDVKVELTD